MKLIVLKGKNLNTEVFRGYAPITDLARISAPDTFNQDTNPKGLQRDLSDKHARDAYRYAIGTEDAPEHTRAWPEILLNVRDESVVRVKPLYAAEQVYEIEILEDRINKARHLPQISRTDGNHRLHYGTGDARWNWEPLSILTSFAMTLGLTPEAEAYLFMDINDHQKAMNTSHLAHLRARLTEEEKLQDDDPALWLAEKLADDPKSPWHGIIHKGGARAQGTQRRVNLAALSAGVRMTLKDAVKLRSMDDIESKYGILRMFWTAVSHTFAYEWAEKKSMLLKGIGIWTLSIVGADIIDRCLVRGIFPAKLEEEMEGYLRQTKLIFNWESDGSMQHYGGQTGAAKAAAKMKAALSDDDPTSVNINKIAAAVKQMV